MDKTHLFVEVANTTSHLAEHRTGVIVGECGTTVTFENIIESTGRTEKHEEKVGVRSVGEMETRQDVLVRERLPYGCFVFKAGTSLRGVSLGSYVGVTYDFDGDGPAGRREGTSDSGKTSVAYDTAELITVHFFTLVIG
jgi:hypothetical protein